MYSLRNGGCAGSRTRLLIPTKLPRADARVSLTLYVINGPEHLQQGMLARSSVYRLLEEAGSIRARRVRSERRRAA